MDYLISSIRQEMLSRIKDNDGRWHNTLLIDFEQENNFVRQLPCKQVQFISLLQSGRGVIPKTFPAIGVSDGTFDSVIIIGQMAWFDFHQVLTEVMRMLKPNGVFYFATFGPDTLIELSQLFSKVGMNHAYSFVDMHHLGDQLLRMGFVRPILDIDKLKVIYPDIESLFVDLKQKNIRGHYVNQRKTLLGKQRYSRLLEISRQQQQHPMTFEVIHGYAQKPEHYAKQHNDSIQVTPPTLGN